MELCPLACTQHRDVRACSSRREWHVALAIVGCQVAGPTCSSSWNNAHCGFYCEAPACVSEVNTIFHYESVSSSCVHGGTVLKCILQRMAECELDSSGSAYVQTLASWWWPFRFHHKRSWLCDQLGDYQLLYDSAPYGQTIKLQVATHHTAR